MYYVFNILINFSSIVVMVCLLGDLLYYIYHELINVSRYDNLESENCPKRQNFIRPYLQSTLATNNHITLTSTKTIVLWLLLFVIRRYEKRMGESLFY